MKIGILTFHNSINNGAVMQCYSLSKRLQQQFPLDTVEVIDYRMPKVIRFYDPTLANYFGKNKSPMRLLKKAVKLLISPPGLGWQRKRRDVFANAISVLPLSGKTILSDGTEELFDYINAEYDIVIAGSDAIWNYVMRGYPNPYFLSHTIHCPKFSYAASCYGMSFEKLPETQKKEICAILDSYTFLGIRDDESGNFLREIDCKVTPVHTCDPTIFLQVDDLPIDEERLRNKLIAKGFDFNRETIGVMGSEKMCKMIRTMYGDNYQIAAVYNFCRNADVNLYDLTPYEWAYVFRYFRVTFTTFFHGTLLSLRNGTPVVCVALETEYSNKHMTKVEDVLRRLGLENWYFYTDYISKNFSEIKGTADQLLAGDFKTMICEKMDKEAQTANAFFSAIAETINRINNEKEI